MMDDWFINIACTRRGPQRRLNQFVPEIVTISPAATNGIGHEGAAAAHIPSDLFWSVVLGLEHISSAIMEGAMQHGPKTVMRTRQPKPAGSFPARPKRWTPSAARIQSNGHQNAQRSYERIWR
jgi:hypothetical protein